MSLSYLIFVAASPASVLTIGAPQVNDKRMNPVVKRTNCFVDNKFSIVFT